VNTTENNKYIYPLTPGARGKFVIAKSDPNNTPLGRAKLEALYGAGNVIVVPDSQFLSYVGSDLDLVSLYASENFSPLSVATGSGGNSGVTPAAGPVNIGLPAPTNLKLGSSQTVSGTNGTNTISIPVFFNTVTGADGYEITYTSNNTYSTANITGVSTSGSGSGLISVSWNALSSASNYTFTVTNVSNNQYSSVLVTPTFGSSVVSSSMSVPTGYSYTATITPYNSNGYAGTAYTTTQIAA